MDAFWDKTKETSVKHKGEYIRALGLDKKNKAYFTYNEVYERAQKIRELLHMQYNNAYEMTVAVLDKTKGGWRGGKFLNIANENIYIWSPDDYDKNADLDQSPPESDELMALDVRIYFKKVK